MERIITCLRLMQINSVPLLWMFSELSQATIFMIHKTLQSAVVSPVIYSFKSLSLSVISVFSVLIFLQLVKCIN